MGSDDRERSADQILLVDVRRFTSELIRPLLISLLDELVALDARDDLFVIAAYEPTGLQYELDMRRETRGRFRYECSQRSDGAWVETISRV